MHKENLWLKEELKLKGIYQYQLAKVLGYNEVDFCKLLREPISKDWLLSGLKKIVL